jgi:hypothetical protein
MVIRRQPWGALSGTRNDSTCTAIHDTLQDQNRYIPFALYLGHSGGERSHIGTTIIFVNAGLVSNVDNVGVGGITYERSVVRA